MDRVALLPLVARWWWVLALATLLAGGAGYVAVAQVPKTYRAETQALVGRINTDTSLDVSGALAGTYADIVTSQNVLDAAIRSTGSKYTTKELDEATTAISNDVTRIVTITVEHRDPTWAARLANALARRLSQLSTREDELSKVVLEAFNAQPEIEALQGAARVRVRRAAQRVFAPSVAGRVTIIDPARPPESAAKPVVPLVVLLAAVSGMLIAGVFILVWESRRPREPR